MIVEGAVIPVSELVEGAREAVLHPLVNLMSDLQPAARTSYVATQDHTSTRRQAVPPAVLVYERRSARRRLRSQEPQTVQAEWLEVPPVQGDEWQPVGGRRCG